jgi:tRNA/tmRNA/rRNA uracil-C5-methylase (TrmA/RlmC/RlmD family)
LSRRAPRERAPRGPSAVGRRLELTCGPWAHGGHVVARVDPAEPDLGGTVVFVRHALPGEQVTVELTEGAVGDRFLRGDAVAVHTPSSDRVEAPCPVAGPGLCGGCDLQHVRLEAQREAKAGIVAEQLRRLAGIDTEVVVEPLRADEDGLRWRTRVGFHRLRDGGLGMRAHRSHRVVPVEDCLVRAPDAVVSVREEWEPPKTVIEQVGTFALAVDGGGFWQAHRDAPAVFVETVLQMAELRPGDQVADLFSGVGLFSVPSAEAVGESGGVLAVEGDETAAGLASSNLSAYPWARVSPGAVADVLAMEVDHGSTYDVVVLDPPRIGAKRKVLEQVVALGPRTIVHVACDPASFARDTAILAEHGYVLADLRAFDAFPMTHHVEVIAKFVDVPVEVP